MSINDIYGALRENIDLTTQSPLEVLATVYGIMDSVAPVTCVQNIKEGIGLYIRDCDNKWEPTEKNTFSDDVYGALRENIDLKTQTPFNVVTELYEVMDLVEPVTSVKSVNDALEMYLSENGWSPKQDTDKRIEEIQTATNVVGCMVGHIPEGYYLRKAEREP